MSSSTSASRKRKGPLRLPDGRFMSLAEARALEKPREECNYKDIYEDLSVTKPLSIYFSVTENSLTNGSINGINGYGERPKTPSFREFVRVHSNFFFSFLTFNQFIIESPGAPTRRYNPE
jgi:hypothetical protein